MAMDIRITSGYRIEMGDLLRRQLLAVFQIVIVLNHSFASPVWMPQFLSAGQGRNIRHLPCVSRRTGEQGVCMFAYTCMKSNGTHLGTCIDRFYFGSCCRIGDNENNDLLLDNHFPVINNNQVSSPFYPDDGKIENVQTTSILNHFNNQFTPVKTSTVGIDTSAPSVFNSDKTVINLAQNLATSTEKIYVPVITSTKPNKTSENYVPVGTTGTPPTTTQQYFLSTFQVVHSEGDTTTTTLAPTTQKLTTTRPTLITRPSTTQLLTSIHNRKNETTTTTTTTTKPTTTAKPTTTTKKPSKPVKPYTTTRKPPTKKPTAKPVIKTTTTPKPPIKGTTPKPTKKPSTPTKKPTSTTKPTTTFKPSTAKPTTTIRTTTKAPTTTYQETTSEVIFTKPGLTPTFSTPTTFYGITTFRPDLTPTTGRPVLITGPGLTTFSYVSEGTQDTTLRPETTTSRLQTTSKPTKATTTTTTTTTTTISNEISSSELIGAISEVQEENTNIIFQQAGSTDFPSSPSSALNASIATTSSKPNASVPFFPDTSSSAESTNTPWIEIVQGSSSSSSASASASETETTTILTTTLLSNASSTTHIPMFTGLNASDYTQVCGRRLYPESRVVGGEKSTFGKWPWQISLRQWRTSTYLHKCGAALLNENWAITAAHCVENVPPSDLLLRLGEHDLSTEDEPYGFQERRVQIVASHPQFDPRTFEYDLALLRFYEPVKFQPNIIPVCVPEDNTNFVGQIAYVTGWGRLHEDGPLPSVLQEVSVPVINNTLCENMYRVAGYIEHIPHIFICAGWKKGGFDSCEGDSGGPMVIQRPDKRWLLAGVISWGIGCAEPNQPGVYTRISEFREWIHQILQF